MHNGRPAFVDTYQLQIEIAILGPGEQLLDFDVFRGYAVEVNLKHDGYIGSRRRAAKIDRWRSSRPAIRSAHRVIQIGDSNTNNSGFELVPWQSVRTARLSKIGDYICQADGSDLVLNLSGDLIQETRGERLVLITCKVRPIAPSLLGGTDRAYQFNAPISLR